MALGDGQQHQRQSGPEARGAEPVDRTRRAPRPGGHREDHDGDDDDGEAGGQPEDAVIVGAVVHQKADDHQTGSAAEAQRCRQHRHRRHHPVLGELLAQDRDPDRIERERGRLQDTGQDEKGQDDVVAASTEPTNTMASTHSSTRFLLCRSARRPISGVAAAAASRLAVTAQLTPTMDASS